jgi:hypothetical protein
LWLSYIKTFFAVLVDVEAFQVQTGHLPDPAAGAFEQQVGEHRHLAAAFAEGAQRRDPGRAGGAGDGREQVQVGVELGDDTGGQRPTRWLLGHPGAAVPASERERRPQVGEQIELSGFSQHEAAFLDDRRLGLSAQGPTLVGEGWGADPGEEAFDVGPAERGGVVAAAGSRRQHGGQHAQRPDAMPQGAVADTADRDRRPPLGRLPQPALADGGEIQPAPPRASEQSKIPDVFAAFLLRVAIRESHPVDAETGEAHMVAVADTVELGEVELGHRRQLGGAELVHPRAHPACAAQRN